MDKKELARHLEGISQESVNKVADFHQELSAVLLRHADGMTESRLRDMVESSIKDVTRKSFHDGCFDIEIAMKALLTVVTGAALVGVLQDDKMGMGSPDGHPPHLLS